MTGQAATEGGKDSAPEIGPMLNAPAPNTHAGLAFASRQKAPTTTIARLLAARPLPWSGGEIWLVDLAATAARLKHAQRLGAWLTPSDHQRLKRIRDRAERERRAATYAALRMLVAACVGRRFAHARMLRPIGGAPRLAGVPVAFNLSHSGPFALIGLARRGRIGVDLEEARTLPMSPKNRALITAAAVAIGTDRPLEPAHDADVIQGWTRLESFSKATGRGINRTLADFGIRKQSNPAWHTHGATIADRARRQIANHAVRDLALPLGLKGSVTRGF